MDADKALTTAALAESQRKCNSLTKAHTAALAPWMGAKRALSKKIIPQIGPHKLFVEPFAEVYQFFSAKPPAAKRSLETSTTK